MNKLQYTNDFLFIFCCCVVKESDWDMDEKSRSGGSFTILLSLQLKDNQVSKRATTIKKFTFLSIKYISI